MTTPACAGTDPELWFVTIGSHRQRAAAICRVCPVRETCEAGARARGEEYGIWNARDAAMDWLEVEAPADAVMITAEPTAHLRATVPMRHGSRSSYLLCRDGDDGRACAECKASNASYVKGYRDHGPAVTRHATVDLQIPLFEGVAS